MSAMIGKFKAVGGAEPTDASKTSWAGYCLLTHEAEGIRTEIRVNVLGKTFPNEELARQEGMARALVEHQRGNIS